MLCAALCGTTPALTSLGDQLEGRASSELCLWLVPACSDGWGAGGPHFPCSPGFVSPRAAGLGSLRPRAVL